MRRNAVENQTKSYMNLRLLDGHCYISCDCPIILARYAIGTDTYMPDSAIKFLSVLAAALRNVLGKVYWQWNACSAIAMRSAFLLPFQYLFTE